ncbi:SAM-dependent methyltransferase, MidA family [Evansella caseinilytica]|uniref:SAM-dependent methyltransferase, MidA family n=1 Tax=Evansella caseinilytica TaxID=1503961 RepID=A0A1H3KRX4_9BACI|nr:SAM-dependent methyltransferase [Evansella caseinilytica]SDY54922.1 SAM-dependent methyltransferase, MidA family [Evansella caseinilytica]
MTKVLKKLAERFNRPVSYSEYMEVALYDPEAGYYMRNHVKLGKEGDFYTSNHVHPVFPKTFARFIADILKKEGLPPRICEWGGGDGLFAANVLKYMQEVEPDLFAELQYFIVEASPFHQQLLRDRLECFSGKARIFSSLEDIRKDHPSFDGIVFSNELIDALPVHVVQQKNGELLEILVKLHGDQLCETTVSCINTQLLEWLEKYGPVLKEQRFEICLAMKSWLENIGNWLTKGMLITVDYGYSNEEWTSAEHHEGSLRGYYQHRMIRDPLTYPGEMDLTHHIQWDAFLRIAGECGFDHVIHEGQDRFLLKAGLFTFLQKTDDFHPFSEAYKQNRAIQSLVHPGGISSAFQVSVQGKGLLKQQDYLYFTEDPFAGSS